MKDTEKSIPLNISITAERSITVLPRCLQIFSRRGFVLTELHTEQIGSSQIILHCTLLGPARWHGPLIPLLERVVDVMQVRKQSHE